MSDGHQVLTDARKYIGVLVAITVVFGGVAVASRVVECAGEAMGMDEEGLPGAPLSASSFDRADIGELTWDTSVAADALDFDSDTAIWARSIPTGLDFRPMWIGARTLARLHSGTFRWDFHIERMGEAQINVGFMLMFEEGVDWGFYGYLGSGAYAWAYDPMTGDVVNLAKSIAGGLPRFENGQSGTVTVEAELPREGAGRVRFIVDGRASPDVVLPVGAVITPAASFIMEDQRIRLGELVRSE